MTLPLSAIQRLGDFKLALMASSSTWICAMRRNCSARSAALRSTASSSSRNRSGEILEPLAVRRVGRRLAMHDCIVPTSAITRWPRPASGHDAQLMGGAAMIGRRSATDLAPAFGLRVQQIELRGFQVCFAPRPRSTMCSADFPVYGLGGKEVVGRGSATDLVRLDYTQTSFQGFCTAVSTPIRGGRSILGPCRSPDHSLLTRDFSQKNIRGSWKH